MKLLSHLFLASILMLFSGCIVYRAGYVSPDAQKIKWSAERVPVRYTVMLRQDFLGGDSGFDHDELRRAVGNELRRTGMFSSVAYGEPGEGVRHLNFEFHVVGERPEDASLASGLAALTIFAFPVTDAISFDLCLRVTKDNRHFYTVGKAEQYRYTYWLPLVVASPFWNVWQAKDDVVSATIQSAVLDFAAACVQSGSF